MKDRVLMGVGMLLSCSLLLGQSSNQNYIQTITPKQVIRSVSAVPSGNIDLCKEEISYINGLGYPDQSIQRGETAMKRDLVTLFDYDGFGRTSREYLPFEVSGNSGNYVSGAISSQGSFYTSSTEVSQSAAPYSDKRFDGTVLNKIVEKGYPGTAFQPGGNHTQRITYRTNTANDQVMVLGFDQKSAIFEKKRQCCSIVIITPVQEWFQFSSFTECIHSI
jgi:hypothetical protein